jgi:hypothetical protein
MKRNLLVFGILLLMSIKSVAQDCNCMIDLDSSFSVVPFSSGTPPEYRNDDGSSAAISLPFVFDLYGTPYNSCFINNNGNVSFDAPYVTFVSSGFPINQFPMISPFWADVDTRGDSSGIVHYKITDHALIVRYNNVGYFPMQTNKLNDFQLIISDGQSNLIPNGQNISFCYGDMQWTSGGNPFSGTAAQVGGNAGDGVNAMQIGRFAVEGSTYDGPYGDNDGVDYLDYSSIYFSTNPADSNQAPIDVTNYCDTIIGYAGDSLVFFFYDDQNQNIEYVISDSLGFISIDTTLGGLSVFNGEIASFRNLAERDLNSLNTHSLVIRIAPNTPPGVYPFAIRATDDGDPALTTISHYTFEIVGTSTGIKPIQNSVNIERAYISNGQLMFSGVDMPRVQQLNIHNYNGQQILQSNKMIQSISTDHWSNGVYIFSIRYPNKTVTGKFVK